MITCIITAYARPDTLEAAIQTVRAQTYSDWELLVTVDSEEGITKERILDIVRRNAEEDSRVRLIVLPPAPKESTPYGISINAALKTAKGEYICYLCDDDLYAKDHFEKSLAAFEKYSESSVVYAGLYMENTINKATEILPSHLIRKCGFFTVDHITVMHKKDILDNTGMWTEEAKYRQFGDAEFFMRIARAGYKMYPTGEITCIKRIYPDSLNVYNGGETSEPEKA